MHAIETQNLFFSYTGAGGHHTPILNGVNLSVAPGELVALKGPSGSGKSTLLYLLSGLLGPYQGTVKIAGQDLSKLSDTELARMRNSHIGFVFQQFYLMPKRTVLENIELAAEYGGPFSAGDSKVRQQRASELARQLGLEERLTHFPNQLSGGQQQRVAIARALFNNPRVLLADEPTGSLDTQTSEQIMQILRRSVSDGRSALVITHDPEVAARCDRTILFRDGKIEDTASRVQVPVVPVMAPPQAKRNFLRELWRARQLSGGVRTLIPSATRNLLQNKSRSLLTMMGIVIGIAAILSMLTIGKFTEKKILESYAELGVNTLSLHGFPNWELKATDKVPAMFQFFDWDRDIRHLDKIFPQIRRATPMLVQWDSRAGFGGKSVDSEVRVMGISADGLEILNRKLLLGNSFSQVHIDQRMPVCILGYEIFERLFPTRDPIGNIVHVYQSNSSFGCRVVGVLRSQTTNKEWNKPNRQILLPYTYFQTITDPWSSRMRELAFQVHAGSDIEKVGRGIKAFFLRKYGKSGRFIVGNDSVLLAQMKKFLRLFTLLLGVIALVSVAVGGIGIMNMMLVSVSERLKEIGIRKAFGATHSQIRLQYLLESLLICTVGGLVGLVVGFGVYQLGIYGASQLMPSIKFEWVFDASAIVISLSSIVGVGILSGIVPAVKAERLQVIEALRND